MKLTQTELQGLPGWSTPLGNDNSLIPTTDAGVDIGSATNRVRRLYVSEAIVGATASPDQDAPVDAVAEDPLVIGSVAANSDLTFNAVDPGDSGITIALVDPGEELLEPTIEVTGAAIVITLASDGNDVVTTAAEVVALIEGTPAADALVTVTDEGDGSGIVDPVAATPMTGGIDGTVGSEGQFRTAGGNLYVAIADATRTSQGSWKKVTLGAL